MLLAHVNCVPVKCAQTCAGHVLCTADSLASVLDGNDRELDIELPAMPM